MIFKVLAVLIATFSGSVHCGAMCGGLSLAAGPSPALQFRYQGSRLISYVLIGFIAGWFGSRVTVPAAVPELSVVAGILLSGFLVASGVRLLWSGRPLEGFGVLSGLLGFLSERTLATFGPGRRAIAVGLMTPLLPCGWLLTALVLALASGGPLWGALIFFAVWAGSVPVLAAGPALARLGLRRFGPRGRRWVALAMIGAGFFSLHHRLESGPIHDPGTSSVLCR
jgi:sulfite exporter TauE/SafE